MSSNSQIADLQAELAELRQTVSTLTAEREREREQARQVTRTPSMNGDAAARAAEQERHEAWKRSRGYGPPAPLQANRPPLVQSPDLLAAMYPSKEELEQKEFLEQQARENAARRQRLIDAGEYDPTAGFQSSAARQREIERNRG